jgi:hypothetical protein
MKRTVFLVLALFALMAVGVYAQTEADFEPVVSKDGKSVLIESYYGSATTVNIPARIKNLPVTTIGLGTFSNSPITSVTIPNTVTTIEQSAFVGCTNLTSVTFAGSIPASGFHANAFMPKPQFNDLRDKYLAAGGGAGTYTRPNGTATTWTKSTTAATAPAAAGTAGLKFDLTPDGKAYSVSKGTVNGGDVVIPASYNNLPVTTVANSAFNAAAMVSSVIIPESVTSIGLAAFTSCANLNSVTFGRANTNFTASDFPGGSDLAAKYRAGGAGTYTRSGTTWTKK